MKNILWRTVCLLGFVLLGSLLVAFGPLAAALGWAEPTRGGKILVFGLIGTVTAAAGALAREAFRASSPRPEGLAGERGWHPCENPRCQAPIPNLTRARHCDRRCATEKHRLAKAANWKDRDDLMEVPF